ncbi:MAG: hypothetical protein AB1491_09290 [Thermodesulfobacteriota bacterium]
MGKDNWLTLAEVAYLANLNMATAQDLLKRFGDLITSREFDDAVKFPPETTGIMIALAVLCREGLGTEKVVELIREINGDGEAGPDPLLAPYLKLIQALLFMVDAQNLALRQLVQAVEKITLMLPEMAALMENLGEKTLEKPIPWLTVPPWAG